MIVFCEECGTRNTIEPGALNPGQHPVRCTACNDILRYAPPLPRHVPPETPKSSLRHRLELRLGRLLIIMDESLPTVTMGRQPHNDIEIIDTRVSRSHARIELRDGRFILIDHSTNGTYVKLRGQDDSLTLKRSELPLEGAGTINLGRKMIDRPSRIIYFNLMG